MHIVFFGSGAFGLPTLQHLAERHTVTAIITQPDRPAGRGGRTTPTPVAAWAAEALPETSVLKPPKVASEIDTVRAVGADAWVVIAFGQKLPPALLHDRFAINLHASRLPRWRGAAPINAAMLAGDAETGNSVIALAERMDAGAIYAQSSRPIEPHQTAGELHDLLAADGPELVASVLDAHARGETRPVEQDEARVTIAPKLSKADSWVDFSQPADACRRRIHGLTPWPGVAVAHRGQRLRLHRAESLQDAAAPTDHAEFGSVLDPDTGLVACGAGTSLRLLEVQPAGGKLMAWRDYANGRRVAAGETLEKVAPAS